MRRISIERKKMGRSQRILNPENSLVNNAEVKSMENNDRADIFLPLKNSLDRKEINKWEKITAAKSSSAREICVISTIRKHCMIN